MQYQPVQTGKAVETTMPHVNGTWSGSNLLKRKPKLKTEITEDIIPDMFNTMWENSDRNWNVMAVSKTVSDSSNSTA